MGMQRMPTLFPRHPICKRGRLTNKTTRGQRYNGIGIMSPTATAVIRSAKDLSDDEARQHQALDQARALLRGSSEADSMATMSMSMPNTVSMMDMDDIINGNDETEDDYKASVKSESEEPDGGVSTLHDHQHWKGLSLESKCDSLHHIVSSLPAFKKGKFEYLLDLVCQKEQTTTSTSSTSTSSTTAGCQELPNDGTGGLAGFGQSCSEDEDCFGCKLYILSPLPSFDHCQPLTDIVSIVFLFYINITVAGGAGCFGSTFCLAGANKCGCFVTATGNSPVGGCCFFDVDCSSNNCDTSNDLVPGTGTLRCVAA